jgi:hypothetical protein
MNAMSVTPFGSDLVREEEFIDEKETASQTSVMPDAACQREGDCAARHRVDVVAKVSRGRGDPSVDGDDGAR